MTYVKAMKKNGTERLWCVYEDECIIRESFNLNVIARFLGKRFNRLYKNRVIEEV